MIEKLIKPLVALLLLIYFLVLVIARTPATVGAWALHNTVPNLWLTGVTGTIWKGQANGAQVDMGKTSVPLGVLEWELKPLSILTLSPCLTFSATYPGQNAMGLLCQSLGGSTRVENTSVDGALDVISEIVPGAKVSGRASLQVVRGVFSGTKISDLEAQLTWEQASVNLDMLNKWMSFGSYAAKLSENGNGGVKAKIFDLSGPYKVDILGDWAAAKGWKVEGTVTPGDGALSEVKEGLSMFGEETPPGSNTFKVMWP